MKISILPLVFAYAALAIPANAAPLPCLNHGKERWPVKITSPEGAKKKTMTLSEALALPKLDAVKRDDPRYENARISDGPVPEDSVVTLSGWLYLIGFESDDCDFHIQISPEPRTSANPPTAADDCIIVEAPSGEYATTISTEVEGVRQWIVDNLLNKADPKIGSVHVMGHPTYVTVTGALFYDDGHSYEANGGTGRGKKGMQSKTLWELHPVTSIAFATAPAGAARSVSAGTK